MNKLQEKKSIGCTVCEIFVWIAVILLIIWIGIGCSQQNSASGPENENYILEVTQSAVIKCGANDEGVQYIGMPNENTFSLKMTGSYSGVNPYYPAAGNSLIRFYSLILKVVDVSPKSIILKCP